MDVLPTDVTLPPGVKIMLTTRNGGVSDPPFHSLNLSFNVGDETEAVEENRLRLGLSLPAPPRWVHQAHGSHVLPAEAVTAGVDVADATITRRPDTVCAVQTADCVPVLLFCRDGGGVGAAHAGWRGLAAGILENTVAALQKESPAALHACIGPAISAENYVVGEEVRAALCRDEQDKNAFAPCKTAAHKWHADLPQLAANRLMRAGVAKVHTVPRCTYGEKNLFFSARRDGARTGRQAALIYFTA